MESTPRTPLLLCDSRGELHAALSSRLVHAGFDVTRCATPALAVAAVGDRDFRVALVELRAEVRAEVSGELNRESGDLALVEALKSRRPDMEVVVLAHSPSIEGAVASMKLGVFDYLVKPMEPERLVRALGRARDRVAQPAPARRAAPGLIGDSPAMRALRERLEAVAPTAATVLITGESGTGKELVARGLHAAGPSAAGPFVPVDCSRLHPDRMVRELFDDADSLLLAAAGGTLFLDEIGSLCPPAQAALLRFLDAKAYRPYGKQREVEIDLRLVASTRLDLSRAIAEGLVRADLVYRLAVVPLHLPPLRDRAGDVPLLVEHFVNHFNVARARAFTGVAPEALAELSARPWPGNVRELRNAIEAAAHFAPGPTLTLADFSPPAPRPAARLPLPGVVSLKDAERQAIAHAFRHLKGNKSSIAQALGISRKQLYVKLALLGLGPPDDR